MSFPTAGEVMDRSAALMNDPEKTDYTYVAQFPYLKMAIDELLESLEESNSAPTNIRTFTPITVPIGSATITGPGPLSSTNYPYDLVEIQEMGERLAGSKDPYIPMKRLEFVDFAPIQKTLGYWSFDNYIRFNPNGASTIREIQLKYVSSQAGFFVDDSTETIDINNSISFLAYKTAAFCAFFIGENETRAAALESLAEKALERLTGINNKGRQQIMTRHRPFRAAYKARGGM